ncbi:MAG: hypothetical protein SH807_05115 [Blastochloris sp.]|jgi:hypothetical protein|nr:hypothetical protein [Blastochloris sp.]
MIKSFLLALTLVVASFSPSFALTAYQAKDVAKREVNDVAKKSLVQIHGKRGAVGVYPLEWEILFYDPYADQDGTKVKVAGNVITQITQGYTQMDKARIFAYKQDEILDPTRLKVDSNEIVKILSRSSALNNVKITSVDLSLSKMSKGPMGSAMWSVVMYAKDSKQEEVEFGKAQINAESGQILQLKIDLKKLIKK